MLEWKDVLPMVVSTLGGDATSLPCVLDFLRVLPEEITEGRKINLTVCPTKPPVHRPSRPAENLQIVGIRLTMSSTGG